MRRVKATSSAWSTSGGASCSHVGAQSSNPVTAPNAAIRADLLGNNPG